MTKKKSDEEILFSQVSIDGITVKPFSFGVLFDVSGLLDSVIDKAEKKGLIDEITKSGNLSYIHMVKLFTLASDEVLKIIAIVTGKTTDEIKALSVSDGIKIAYVIFIQNKEILKNALSSLSELAAQGRENLEKDS